MEILQQFFASMENTLSLLFLNTAASVINFYGNSHCVQQKKRQKGRPNREPSTSAGPPPEESFWNCGWDDPSFTKYWRKSLSLCWWYHVAHMCAGGLVSSQSIRGGHGESARERERATRKALSTPKLGERCSTRTSARESFRGRRDALSLCFHSLLLLRWVGEHMLRGLLP